MSTKNVTLKEKVNGVLGDTIFPATTTPNVYDSAKSQALSQTLVNTPDYEALGFAKFSTATAYNAGDKVYKDNELYRFIADKTAGEWDVAKVEPWSIEQEIEEVDDAIRSLIPAQASADNKLADKAYVNDKVSTDTATFRGTFNLVTDLDLTTEATQGQIATALGTAISGEDKNDYAFVQIPTSDATPTEIARIDRYKYIGLQWAFEYSINNSGFTAEQWAAINSGITSSLVTAFGAKYDKPAGGIPASDMNTSTFDDEPTAGSENLVKSGGIKGYYNFVKNSENRTISCTAGTEIGQSDSILPMDVKTGERIEIYLSDLTGVLSGNPTFFVNHVDGTRANFGLVANTKNEYTLTKETKSFYVWISGTLIAASGTLGLTVIQEATLDEKIKDLEKTTDDLQNSVSTISGSVGDLDEGLDDLGNGVDAINKSVDILRYDLYGINRSVESNAVQGQEIGRRESSPISTYLPVSIPKDSVYYVYFASGDILSTNPTLFVTYKDGTETNLQINKNQDWFYRIAEKDIVSFGVYVGGPYVTASGEVTLAIKQNGAIDNIIDAELTDSKDINRCISALYIPNRKADEIQKIRVVKAAQTGQLYYNALYIFFTDGTNIGVFTDGQYTTQSDAANGAVGIRGSERNGGWAIIDYSSVSNGTTEFTNFKVMSDISCIATFSSLYNALRDNTGWNDKEYTLNLIDDVICIGDSITEGNIYDAPYHSGVVNKLSYPSQLAKMTGWEVTNAGKSGITTVGWWEDEFAKYNYANYKLAIIYLGTNGGFTETIDTDAPEGTDYHNYADTNTGRLCSIIEGIKAQNSNILITILIGSNLQANEDIPTIETIKTVAERYSLILINLRESIHFRLMNDKYHGYANVGDQTLNYTHFNAAGYLTMAKAIKEYLSDWFDNNIKSVSNVAY